MELRRLSAAELSLYLEGRAPALRDLPPAERNAVIRMAGRLAGCDLAPRFILASVDRTVDLLRGGAGMPLTNAPAPESIVHPAPESRNLAARRLGEKTRAVLREARSARRSNEVRKMRCMLRQIDQGWLRESLGEEGAHLCREVNRTLEQMALPVRRGRPRTQRVAV